jgi:two-component system phosphate regulon response regulator PhoB
MSKKIVVIEDDRDILDMMQCILEDEGYQVMPFSRAESIEEIIKQKPNLILLDDRLKDTSGHLLCKRIKTHPVTRSIPVIMVSAARGLNEMAERCLADTYLPKPFDLTELVDLVKTYT